MDADIVEADEVEGAREISPVQFFKQDENPLVDRDFRPRASKIDDTERTSNVPTEDGHGHHLGDLTLDPSQAHNPHVSPIPEREYMGGVEDDTTDSTGTGEDDSKTQQGPFDSK